jgi:hypothetical protein
MSCVDCAGPVVILLALVRVLGPLSSVMRSEKVLESIEARCAANYDDGRPILIAPFLSSFLPLSSRPVLIVLFLLQAPASALLSQHVTDSIDFVVLFLLYRLYAYCTVPRRS